MRRFAAGAVLLGLTLSPVLVPPLPRSPKLRIVASILPLQEFAAAVAGGDAEVSLLLPPGAGVHTWQPRAGDIIRMSGADLFVQVGGGLEPWVDDFLRSVANPRLKVIAAAEFLPLEKEAAAGHGAVDPHVWLDFENDQKIVNRLGRTLGEIDPERAAAYANRAAAYNVKLKELDDLYAESLGSCAHRVVLLAGHEAFGYLVRRYGLEQVSLTGLSPNAEPTTSAVASMIELARKRHIGSVFMESRESPRLAELLAREIPARIFVLNPGANLSRQEWASGTTFLDLMRDNLANLRKGLGCE